MRREVKMSCWIGSVAVAVRANMGTPGKASLLTTEEKNRQLDVIVGTHYNNQQRSVGLSSLHSEESRKSVLIASTQRNEYLALCV